MCRVAAIDAALYRGHVACKMDVNATWACLVFDIVNEASWLMLAQYLCRLAENARIVAHYVMVRLADVVVFAVVDR